MRIFSYIFYTFSKIYRAGLDKRDPDIYAGSLLGFLQGINAYTVIKPFLNEGQDIYAWIIIVLVLFPVNKLLFNRKALEKFDKRWDNEPKGPRFFKRFLIALYVIITFALPTILYMKPIQ